MLSEIMKEIHRDMFEKEEHQMMLESTSDEIKNLLLDSVEMDILGAENDPEIIHLLDTIPEYEDTDEMTKIELESLVESLQESII